MLEVFIGGFAVIVIGLSYLYVTNKALHAKVDKLLGHTEAAAPAAASAAPAPATIDHAAVIAAAAKVVEAAAAPVRTVSGAHDDTVLNAFLGRTAQTDAILNAAVANQPKGDAGWQPGATLDAFGVGRQNIYAAGVPFPYTVVVPGAAGAPQNFEFVWADCPGTPPGMGSAVISGPAGTFTGPPSFLKLGSVPVHGSKGGETYSAVFTATAAGPGHAQINPLAQI